jgi:hypothetical protein
MSLPTSKLHSVTSSEAAPPPRRERSLHSVTKSDVSAGDMREAQEGAR